jgi:hypothetical protein
VKQAVRQTLWAWARLFPGDVYLKFAEPRLVRLQDCILQPSSSTFFPFATTGPLATQRSSTFSPWAFWHEPCCKRRENAMKDLLFTSITIAFFAAAWLYSKACEKL